MKVLSARFREAWRPVAMIGMSTIPAFLQRAGGGHPDAEQEKNSSSSFKRGAADGLNIVGAVRRRKLLPDSSDHRPSRNRAKAVKASPST